MIRYALAAALALAATPALAAWPDRPVRLVVPYAAGGPTDIIARVIAEAASAELPHRILVENRTGAGGAIGAAAVAKADPDGHSLLFTNIGYAALPALFARLEFDPPKDLRAVTIVAESPMVLLVPPNAPFRTVQDFVARAKAEPGRLTYGSTGGGGALQLVSLLFIQAAGIELTEVPYRGSAPAVADLAAGRLDMLYDAGLTGFGLAKGGQARALVVSSAQRSPVMPDVPTVAEVGLPEATFAVWQAVLAPADTRDATVERINAVLVRAIRNEGVAKRLAELGAERLIGNSHAEAQRFVASEILRWKTILARAGVKPQ
jgi:tripartite-type tricarboxylate transporter receptor subunit TctC